MNMALLGFTAATLTPTAFLPQVTHSWKSRQTKDISLPAYLALTIGVFLWFIYGIILQAPPIYVANGLTFVLTLSIVYLKLKHG